MYLRYRVRFLFIGIILLVAATDYGQPISFQQLEQKVYKLNNELKYNQSQALLLPVLQDKSFSADTKYQAAILLSYTYKRVFDYQSTLKFLNIAETFAEETPQRAKYIANIQAEKAFVLFDTHAYRKANALMEVLEKTDFKYINLENKSKLVMQQGYLRFLGKQYKQAEATYDRAIQLMRASAPCHLPMILVKKMQLYNAMNRLDLLQDALAKSTVQADSCKITKYHLYAHEELLAIYQKRNDFRQIARTQKKLDSLNTLYAREENTASLHEQKETILLAEKDKELQQEQTRKSYLTIALSVFVLSALVFLAWFFRYRGQKRGSETAINRIASEQKEDARLGTKTASDKGTFEQERLTGLSERQRDVLACMAEGMSNKQIADKLFISENTVKYHIKNIYQILNIKDRKDFLLQLKK